MQTKINTLKELLPSSPFVVEQVGQALKLAQEVGNEEALVKALDQAIYLAGLANKFSNPSFYAYKPIVCALLSLVEDEESLEVFKTETNSVLVTLAELKHFTELLETNTNEACTYFAQSILNQTDLPLIGFAWMIEHVKTGEQLEILKIAYLSMNVILSKFEFTGATYEAYNDMLKALNKAQF